MFDSLKMVLCGWSIDFRNWFDIYFLWFCGFVWGSFRDRFWFSVGYCGWFLLGVSYCHVYFLGVHVYDLFLLSRFFVKGWKSYVSICYRMK